MACGCLPDRVVALIAAALPAPAWAAAPLLPRWGAYALFVGAALVVIALLLRDALSAADGVDQPNDAPDRARSVQARYDAREAGRKTAANRRVA